ncbi:MAG: ComE operon protein 3 [Flavobacteriaceae bacterium]|nr:MAG: ComE operon protein 3 [Flavobacteriaceae bacterium]
MQIPAHFSVRLLIYWISGILLSNYYTPSISLLLIAFCSWILSTHYNSVYLEEFLLGCSILILSAHLTLTFHSKEETPVEEPLIIFIESFEGNTTKYLHYNAQWREGSFKVFSKAPIENAYYLINELPKKGFNEQLVLFVDGNKLAEWQKLTEILFHFPFQWIASLRNSASKQWEKMKFSPVLVGFYRALILGDRSMLAPEIKTAFQQLGLAHVLAVSGMHFGLYYLLFNGISLLLPFKLRRGFRVMLNMSYAVITGLGVSVIRALIFILIYELGIALKRPIDRWQLFIATALICLMLQPNWIYDVGFQLSFTAVLGIFVGLYFLDNFELPQLLKKPIQLVTISFSAQLAVSPILAFYFEELSLTALPFSIIASPIVPIVMIIGGAGLFLPIGSITNPLITGLLKHLTHVTPRRVQICIDLPEVISIYLMLGLLVYVAHQALHKRRKKEY